MFNSAFFFFFLPFCSASTHKCAPTRSCNTSTGMKDALKLGSVVMSLTDCSDFGGVERFDFAGSHPENVFLDGFLAEAMFGELWPAHFTCQLLSFFFFPSSLQCHTEKCNCVLVFVSPPGPTDQVPYSSVSPSGSTDSPSINLF